MKSQEILKGILFLSLLNNFRTMKKILLFLGSIFLFQVLEAQNTSDVGKIILNVTPIESTNNISESQQSLLVTKLVQIITSEGMSSFAYGNFNIIPKISIQNTEIVESGMRNIDVVWLDLSLTIQENITGSVFSSYVSTLKGSGIGNERAIQDAINKVNSKSTELKSFISESKKKILKYYKEKCNSIIEKSESFAQRKQYEEAIALLMSIPDAVTDCYLIAQKKSLEIYTKYQEKNCKEQIQKAKALIASEKYEEALSVLMNIESSTSCFNEAKKQIAIIENKIKTEDNKQWDFLMQQYKDKILLEKHRIDAIKEIAATYYREKTTSNNVYIVK